MLSTITILMAASSKPHINKRSHTSTNTYTHALTDRYAQAHSGTYTPTHTAGKGKGCGPGLFADHDWGQ